MHACLCCYGIVFFLVVYGNVVSVLLELERKLFLFRNA